tara:strand:- start:259 stop:963 length:705 start_codon:yes stop_codon:yes gene_type:complete
MNLDSLKNFDVKDLVQKLKGMDLLSDKKTLTQFGIGFGAVAISLIIYYTFVSPVVERQKINIETMNQNNLQIEDLKISIQNFTQQIKDIEPEYEKNSKLFHSKKEVEDLYQSISNFALANGLQIINLKKGQPTGVGGPSEEEMIDMNAGEQQYDAEGNPIDGEPQAQGPLYYQIPVDYEIQGTFLGYLKFRRALSKSLKVINFDKEEINLLKDPAGQVLSKGTISIVGLPNEYK